MTYYNCAKFPCRIIISFGVSGGGGGVKMTPLGINVSENTLSF